MSLKYEGCGRYSIPYALGGEIDDKLPLKWWEYADELHVRIFI